MLSDPRAVAVLSFADLSQKKLSDGVVYHVLGDKTTKSTTKRNVHMIPPKIIETKPTSSQGRTSALKSNRKSNTM